MEKLLSVLSWPLKKLLMTLRNYPRVLESGTRLVSRFPLLFDGLVGFAQDKGIIMSDEEEELEQIQSEAELPAEARDIYEALKIGFKNRSNAKP